MQRPKKAPPRARRAQGSALVALVVEVYAGDERPPRWSQRLVSSHPSSRDERISFTEEMSLIVEVASDCGELGRNGAYPLDQFRPLSPDAVRDDRDPDGSGSADFVECQRQHAMVDPL